MLTYEDARKKGIEACFRELGEDFTENRAQVFRSASAYNEKKGEIFCIVAADTKPHGLRQDVVIREIEGLPVELPDDSYPYRVSCIISLGDGSVEFLERITEEKTAGE